MKRVASETLTKEHGSSPNIDSTDHSGDSVSKMANAAQLARRKLATPKSRLGRATTPTGGLTSSTNPAPNVFATAGFGSQPTQSFQAPSSMFSFGASSNTSSSFPPPSQSSFNFSAPGSQSFTFGQDVSQQSNPFANVNGNNANTAGADNTMMDTSPQKPPPAFNFGAAGQSTISNGSLFGGQQSQPQSQSQIAAPAFGGALFGQPQSKPEVQNPSTNSFGQTSQPIQNGFGGGGSGGLFGQSASPSTSSAPLFGGFGSTTQPTTTSASSQSSPFKFGESTSKPQEDSTPSTQSQPFGDAFKPSQPLFGSGSSASQTAATSAPIFGASPATSSDAQPASKPLFSFGTPAPAPTSKSEESRPAFGSSNVTSNIFGQSPRSTESPPPAPQNIFGQPSSKPNTEQKSPEPESRPPNPFAGLFGSQPSAGASAPAPSEKPKPLFSFGQSSSFGSPSKPSEDPAKSANEDTPKPVFAFGTPAVSSAPKLFESASNTTPSSTTLFNLNKPTPSAEPSVPSSTDTNNAQTDATPKISGSGTARLFGKTLPAFGTPSESAEGPNTSGPPPNPFASLTQPSISSPVKDSSNPSAFQLPTAQTPSKAFDTAATSPPKPTSSSFGSTSRPQPAVTPSSVKTAGAEPPSQSIQRSISTEGPPQIPRYLNAQKYKSYDENWRLKSLNRQFKDAVLQLDPDRHDFMNIIQNYLDHREGIGEGLAFYDRQKAGMKRKADDVDELQQDRETNKRSKPGNSNLTDTRKPAADQGNATPSARNLFASLSSPQPSSSAQKPIADPKTAELFRSMIPGAQSSSTGKSTTPPSSPPKKAPVEMPKFELPKFVSGPTNFMDAFAKQSASSVKKFEEAEREKRKAEEFDSDEDDEEEWNRRYEEEQRAKKAKISGVASGGFTPTSTGTPRELSPFNFNAPPSANNNSTSSSTSQPFLGFNAPSGTDGSSSQKPIEIDEDEEDEGEEQNSGDEEGSQYEPGSEEAEEDDLPEDEVDGDGDEDDDEGSEVPDLPAGQSLFGRITRDGSKANGGQQKPATDSPIFQPAQNASFKPGLMFGNIGKSTPEAPGFSPVTPAGNSQKPSFVPTTTFQFSSTPTPASSSTPVLGASVFSGGPLRDGPIPGEGLFGSRPSTPLNGERPRTSMFGQSQSSTSPNDKTWKPGSAIKFGSSADREAPSVEITEATPPAKQSSNPFSGLFGNASGKASPVPNSGASLGFNFGNPSNATGLLAPHLAGGNSGISSGFSSRATSPGGTDNESVATDNTEDYSNEPQASLMDTNAGEKDERVLFESRAQIQHLFKKDDIAGTKYTVGWNKMGLGNLRILKNKDTGKTRILMRAEPSANILLNTYLVPGVDYKATSMGKGGSVTFGASVNGKFGTWMLQVKTKDMAEEVAKILNENKS